jgi:hypothetical protein
LRKFSGLSFFARRKRNGADLGDTFDHVGNLGPEELGDPFGGGESVFDDVVQEAGSDGHDVKFHVGEEVSDFERMDQVRFAGMAHLAFVFERGETYARRSSSSRLGTVASDFLEQGLETNHGNGV